MYRYILTALIIFSLVFAGCSKKDEEVEALEKAASVDETAEVMDSLEQGGYGEAETDPGLGEPAAETTMDAEEETYRPDYSQSGEIGYVVQIGSYSDYDFAQMKAEKFINREYQAFVTQVDIDGEIYYRLRVGVYETYQEAADVGETLKDRFSVEYWVDSNR